MKKFLAILDFLFRTLFILIMIFTLYIAFFQKEWLISIFKFLTEKAETFGNWNYLIAFLFAFGESIPILGTVSPGQNAVIIIGFVLSNKLLFIVIAAGIGAILGDFVAFYLGKKFGKSFFDKYGDIVGIGNTEITYLEKQLEKNGFWFLVLGKFNNFIHNYMPFIAGTTQMENKKFWIFNIIGSIAWVIVIILLGAFFHNNYEMILNNLSKIIIVLIMSMFAYIFFFKKEEFKKYMDTKEQEIENKNNLKKQKNG
ncbi:MAG: DedA family protein [Candidatus Gracilibacteria bacterium]|nr:DedA family protein [Candidatus Gracilibacteria bacterium]